MSRTNVVTTHLHRLDLFRCFPLVAAVFLSRSLAILLFVFWILVENTVQKLGIAHVSRKLLSQQGCSVTQRLTGLFHSPLVSYVEPETSFGRFVQKTSGRIEGSYRFHNGTGNRHLLTLGGSDVLLLLRD